MPRPAPFVIAQLSDLHLTRRESDPRSEPRLWGHLTGMNAAFRTLVASSLIQAADLVLVTGDVTDRGDVEAWKLFWAGIAAAGLGQRTLVIPGNHDVCCLGLRYGQRKRLAARDLARVVKGLELGGQPLSYPWVRRVDERVAVFGLDTNNAGNLTVADNAVGRLGYPQLERFARLLRRHAAVRVKVVALHHSPNIPFGATALRRGQRALNPLQRAAHELPRDERRALRLLCATHGVRVVLHGHLHMAEDRRVGAVRIIGAPSSTEPVDKSARPRRYRVYTHAVRGAGGRIESRLNLV